MGTEEQSNAVVVSLEDGSYKEVPKHAMRDQVRFFEWGEALQPQFEGVFSLPPPPPPAPPLETMAQDRLLSVSDQEPRGRAVSQDPDSEGSPSVLSIPPSMVYVTDRHLPQQAPSPANYVPEPPTPTYCAPPEVYVPPEGYICGADSAVRQEHTNEATEQPRAPDTELFRRVFGGPPKEVEKTGQGEQLTNDVEVSPQLDNSVSKRYGTIVATGQVGEILIHDPADLALSWKQG